MSWSSWEPTARVPGCRGPALTGLTSDSRGCGGEGKTAPGRRTDVGSHAVQDLPGVLAADRPVSPDDGRGRTGLAFQLFFCHADVHALLAPPHDDAADRGNKFYDTFFAPVIPGLLWIYSLHFSLGCSCREWHALVWLRATKSEARSVSSYVRNAVLAAQEFVSFHPPLPSGVPPNHHRLGPCSARVPRIFFRF